EVVPLEVLHDDVRPAVLVRVDVDHAHDVRALQPGRGARLALEPRDDVSLLRQVAVEHLDRDALIELRVDGLEHRRHPAFADDALDDVLAEGATRLDARRLRLRDHRRVRITAFSAYCLTTTRFRPPRLA